MQKEILHENKIFTEPKLVCKNKVQQEIECACGCGQKLLKYDKSWRERKNLPGHNKNRSNITFKELKDYLNKGYSRREVSNYKHVATTTISQILKENNYKAEDARHGERFKNKIANYNKTKKDYSFAVGNKNHNYKEIKKNSEGYILENARNHPFAMMGKNQLIMKHRLVMENNLKENHPDSEWLIEINGEKYLTRNCAVHHINRIKDDNRIENLQVMTISNHSKLHHIDRYTARMEKKLCVA